MRISAQVGIRRDFVLTKALLIYEEQVEKREHFATVHNVIRQKAEQGHPHLGPGSLLTENFLEILSEGLRRPAKAVLLPENVLAYTSDLLIWWTPPRIDTMFFSDGAEDRRMINGRAYPHPALIWKVRQGRLFLRAIPDRLRPLAATPLMVAPYWNTNPGNGDVCEGSMPRPRETNLTNMDEWVMGFFRSQFTHPSGIGKLTSHPGGFMGLWTELAGQESFPAQYLVAAKQTMRDFVEQR